MKSIFFSLAVLLTGAQGQGGGGGIESSSKPLTIPGIASTTSGSSSTPTSATAAASITATTTPTTTFGAAFNLPTQSPQLLGTALNLMWTLPDTAKVYGTLDLVLCSTNASSSESLSSANTLTIVQLRACDTKTSNTTECEFKYGTSNSFDYGVLEGATYSLIQRTGQDLPGYLTELSFFFCFGNRISNGAFNCYASSSYFTLTNGIDPSSNPTPRNAFPEATIPLKGALSLRAAPLPIPETLTIISHSSYLSYLGEPENDSANIFGTSTAAVPTASAAVPSENPSSSSSGATVTPTATPSTSSKKSSGLSVGAKVGIAIGALAIAAILLLLALFFLRRKHHARRQLGLIEHKSAPEQAMLTRDMHVDSFQSRNNILAEKDEIASSSTPLQNQNGSRTGQAAAAAVPRRKPIEPTTQTTSNTNPNIARGLSTVSRVSEPNTSRSGETYNDNSTHTGGAGTRVPFLTEEGMSAEEVARLEEEERRIDAAIAEAEGREGR